MCWLVAMAEVQIEACGWHHRMEVVILGIGPPRLPIRSVVRTLSSQQLSPTHLRWYLQQDQQVEHIVEFGSSTVRTLEYHYWRYHRPDRRAPQRGIVGVPVVGLPVERVHRASPSERRLDRS